MAIVGIGTVGAHSFAAATQENAAPLEVIARNFRLPVSSIVAFGAITAVFGVLLNLILGLSRVMLAMGRRGPPFQPRLSLGGVGGLSGS